MGVGMGVRSILKSNLTIDVGWSTSIVCPGLPLITFKLGRETRGGDNCSGKVNRRCFLSSILLIMFLS